MRNRTVRRGVFAALALLVHVGIAPRLAHAVPVQLTVAGVIDEITNASLNGDFTLGTAMSATVVFDSDTPPDASLIPTRLLYQNAILGGSYDVDGYAAAISGGNVNVTDDDVDFDDSIVWRAAGAGPALSSSPLSALGLAIVLEDPSQNALSTKALPVAGADVAGLVDRRWFLSFGSALPPAQPPGVGGRITDLQITILQQVPEPSTLTLLASVLSILGVAAGGRRRRREA